MMTHEERVVALEKMEESAARFYLSAIQIGNHPFIEFTGLVNEYIKCCRSLHKRGQDFSECNVHTGVPLPVASYHIDYINEKLSCIFIGHSFMSSKHRE